LARVPGVDGRRNNLSVVIFSINMKVRDLRSYPIYIIRPDAPVTEAVRAMVEGHKGCVLIAREGLRKEVEGIVIQH